MNNIENIIKTLLEDVDKNPDKPVDELLVAAARKMGLGDEAMAELLESLDLLDRFDEKAKSLAEVRKEGDTRNEWLEGQLAGAAGKLGGEKGTIFIEEIKNATGKSLENMLTDENC